MRMRTRPWAPPFPRQTQKGHWRPEHVPTGPQPPGTDAGLQPPAFCCSRCGDVSEAAKVSSLQPPRPQKQQCRIRLLCMSTSSPQASMGRRKEPQGWQISETPWSGERLPCQHTNPHLPECPGVNWSALGLTPWRRRQGAGRGPAEQPPRPSQRQRADLRFSGRLAARTGSAPAGRPPRTWPAGRSPWPPSAE